LISRRVVLVVALAFAMATMTPLAAHAAGPTVTSVTPSTGPVGGGTSVTILGAGFTGATALSFGANAQPTFNVVDDGTITASSPSGSPGVVDVIVTTPGGNNTPAAGDQFTYVGPPTVGSVLPNDGPLAGGISVLVTGTNFTGATNVSFGGTAATAFNVNNDTQIAATSPAGSAGPVDVTVTTPFGTSVTGGGDTFTYVPQPAVSSVAPSSGPAGGGTVVTITGTDLTGASAVTFGGTPATSVTVNNATQVTATSPAGTGLVDVTVTTSGGTSATGAADQFTYIGPPTVSSVSPSAGPLGGAISVTITGTNFAGATAVSFGGTAASSYHVDTSSQITATSPAGAAGAVDVTVTTPSGTSSVVGADTFTYEAPPVVSSVAPSSGQAGGGTSAIISGTDLTGASAVMFGGTPATGFTVNNSTQITATSPAGTGLVDVTVTTAGGISATVAADRFTYVPAPIVSSVAPSSGQQSGGTSVIITGTDFNGATAVSFGGSAATSYHVDTNTQITAFSPAGSGLVDVTVTTAGGTSATVAADQFTYVGAPTVSSVVPNGGPLAGGTSVIINGTGFSGATAVNFGGTAATSFTVNNATEIAATSPAGSGLVDVTVTTPGGTTVTSAADQFTYTASPIVSSVSPSGGRLAGGTSVIIAGTNFSGATAVNFGGTAATSFTIDSSIQVTAISPAGSGLVDVTVTTAGGTSARSAADQFTYTASPIVTSVAPSAGPLAGGTSVIITGTNLSGATEVDFAGNPASFVVNSGTKITATSPAGSGLVDVTVTTPGGTSATGAGDQFSYVAAPTVSSVAPNDGPLAGGISVTINGANLTGATAVSFGGNSASFIINSGTRITASSPSGFGLVDVTVTTAGGTSATSAADQFTYTASPIVSSVSPNSGPLAGGTSVIITGTKLSGATAVAFGSTAATAFTVNSETQITATSPPGSAGAVDVVVTTAGGSSANGGADMFTYVAAPTVRSLGTNIGPVAGGTSVTIAGTNFSGATAVKFGTAAATTFTVTSPTQITATSPAGSGLVHVTVATAGGVSFTSAADEFTYVGLPTVSSVAPNGGPAAGGTLVTITGTNFIGPILAVNFGGSAATSVNVTSPTQMTAVSPAGSGVVDVTVTTSGGTSATSAADQFTNRTVPGAPTSVVAAAANASASVTWLAPASDGGSPITGYTVTVNTQPARSQSSVGTSTVFTGLINGTSYRFTVTATNLIGSGPASSPPSNFVVPGVPSVASVTPNTGPYTGGTVVQILGTTLAAATEVFFGNTLITAITPISASHINVTTPPGSGTVDIKVVVPGGTATLTAGFTYTTTCLTASIAPSTPSPVSIGTSVIFTATSTGCPSPRYEFWLQSTDGHWQQEQVSGPSANWTWHTAGLPAGLYTVHVLASEAGDPTPPVLGVLPFSLAGCLSAGVTGDLASPQTAGIPIHFTATSSGCSSPRYAFFLQYPDLTWVLMQPFSATATWTWNTANFPAGDYLIHVWANRAGDSTASFQSLAELPYTLVILPACTTASLSPLNPSQVVGTTVTLMASATDCPSPQFQFFVQYPNGTWNLLQTWGGSTYGWNTTNLAPGTYLIHAWANEVLHSMTSYETYGSDTVTLTGCTSVSITPPMVAQQAGPSVTVSAIALGCPTPEYQFSVGFPNGTTVLEQRFGGSGFSWPTSGLAPGMYSIQVWANQQGSSSAAPEAVATAPVGLGICAFAAVTPLNPSVPAGSLVSLVASASGCTTSQYEFWVQSNGTWSLLRGWGLPTYDWSTANLPPGPYTIHAWATQVISPTATYQSIGSSVVNLTGCTSASLLSSAPGEPPGTPIDFTASAGGCTSPAYEFWVQNPSGAWVLGQTWGGSAFHWLTAGLAPGIYTVHAWARPPLAAQAPYEVYGSSTVSLTICATASLSPAPADVAAGTPVPFTALATGCSSPQFKFWVQYPNGTWNLGRDWNALKTWSWPTAGLAPGRYTIHVWANNSGDPTTTYEALGSSSAALTICDTATLVPGSQSQGAGTPVSLSAVSTGCVSPQYEFWVQYPNPNGAWHLIQSWGGPTPPAWPTTNLPPGLYTIHVWANNIGDSTATYETYGSGTVTLTGCTSASLLPSSGASPVGTQISFTASSSGCTAVYEFWLQWPDGSWHLMQPFPGGAGWLWNTSTGYAKGTYVIHVWANNQGADTTKYEVIGEATYTLT
jgi:hypothetical protein